MVHIGAAGNADTAAYAVLLEQGFIMEARQLSRDEEPIYVAKRGSDSFTGGGPLEILGLIFLYQARGANWMPTDEEVDRFTEFEAQAFGSDNI